MTHYRCFIAIRLNAEIQAALQSLQDSLRDRLPGLRWVKPANAHITLKFLGDVAENRLHEISSILQQACSGMEETRLELQGLGIFPLPKSPRVLWVGLAGDIHKLQAVVQRLGEQLCKAGWHADIQNWTAHITLARFPNTRHQPKSKNAIRHDRLQARDDVNHILDDYADRKFGSLAVVSVDLMASVLQPAGPEYQPLFVCPLKPS
jgi:RNA 2',3'-cyclic 3'-phosphodiesterase